MQKCVKTFNKNCYLVIMFGNAVSTQEYFSTVFGNVKKVWIKNQQIPNRNDIYFQEIIDSFKYQPKEYFYILEFYLIFELIQYTIVKLIKDVNFIFILENCKNFYYF